MIKFCTYCGKDTIHNPSGKVKEGSPRCVVCAQKKEVNELLSKLRTRRVKGLTA